MATHALLGLGKMNRVSGGRRCHLLPPTNKATGPSYMKPTGPCKGIARMGCEVPSLREHTTAQ